LSYKISHRNSCYEDKEVKTKWEVGAVFNGVQTRQVNNRISEQRLSRKMELDPQGYS
jgi:hypothetical protein